MDRRSKKKAINMDKDDILEAIIAIGRALQQAKWNQQASDRESHIRENRCDVGYPIGTKLFVFDYEDGIEEVVVIGEQRLLVDGRESRWCMKHDALSDTVEGAIRAAIEAWERSGDLNIEEDIRHYEWDLEYNGERVEWATIALQVLRERLALQNAQTQQEDSEN